MTTKEVQVLENEVTLMGKTFNVYGTVEEPLFRANDVADWIEHSNVSAMLQSIDEDEKVKMVCEVNNVYVTSRARDTQEMWFLTENGVYEVLMLSRKPIAKDFKKEVKKMLHALRTKKATLMPTNFADALEAYAKEVRAREEAKQALFAETQQKLAALEQYQNEKAEHQKDKELVTHKYLTATQIKETIRKEYGKNIVVSKAVKRIPLDDNDILYKPFRNENFTGQQPVYHPNVLDKIREILN